jgi:lipopolysaccharide transport system ATP-binding protein
MTEPAISIRNLSKCYRLGTIGRHTLVDETKYWWHKIRGRDPRDHFRKIGYTATEKRMVEAEHEGKQEFWALKDISFDVQPGEVIGIIGRNGAGKSTLLKILTRITEPTSGEAVINGRVASLLEVGTGFHPELTGRENIYMNGTIMGMKYREIDVKFDDIVSFSEIEKFIDTPVKRYSSGMYVRLAFAVAAHLDPEILLIDEVLAVGDAEFQKKCLGKMENVAKQGRTVLFVSHQIGAVAQLCNKAILIHEGKIKGMGSTDEIIDLYLLDRASVSGNEYIRPESLTDGEICIRRARTVDGSGIPRQEFDFKETVSLSIDIDSPQILQGTLVAIVLLSHIGYKLFTTQRAYEEIADSRPGSCRIIVTIPSGLLAPGRYSFLMALHIRNQQILDIVNSACRFTIVDTGSPFSDYAGKDYGAFLVDCAWKLVET